MIMFHKKNIGLLFIYLKETLPLENFLLPLEKTPRILGVTFDPHFTFRPHVSIFLSHPNSRCSRPQWFEPCEVWDRNIIGLGDVILPQEGRSTFMSIARYKVNLAIAKESQSTSRFFDLAMSSRLSRQQINCTTDLYDLRPRAYPLFLK